MHRRNLLVAEDAVKDESVYKQIIDLLVELRDIRDAQDAYSAIATKVQRLTDADYGLVIIYERGGAEVSVLGLAGIDYEKFAEMPPIEVTPEIRDRMLASRRSIAILATEEKDVPKGALDLYRKIGVGCMASASIVHRGELMGYIVIGRDKSRPPLTEGHARITTLMADCMAGVMDHLRTSQILARTTETTDRLVSVAPIGLMTIDRNGVIGSLNKQMSSILANESEEELIGTNLLETPAMERSGLSTLVMEALDGRAGEKNEVHFVPKPDKSFYLHVKVVPLTSEGGDVESALLVAMDVTLNIRLQGQLERSYEKLIQTYQELERVTKMKTQFIDVVSHELRTPLTVMRGYLDLVEAECPATTEPKFAQKMRTIRANADKLYTLVESMLDVSRLEKGTLQISLEPTRIDSLLDEMVKARSHDITDKRQTILLEIEGELPLIMADRRRMKDVFNNVVDNAVKYTPEEGKIQVGARDEGKTVHVWIKDNGVGIPLENLGKIFDRFYIVASDDLSHQVNRIGLSLPISKGIVEAHGGRIWVESQVGKGSVFHVSLPKEPQK